MKAWWIEEHGGNEVLKRRFDEHEFIPGPDEVRIKVTAVGLNHLDLWVRKGVPGHHFPLPLIPGCDVVGRLDDGSRVIIFPVTSCGACGRCVADEPTLCREFGIFGETRNGGAADYLIAPSKNIVSLPDEISDEVAATLPIAGITAWHMLTSKAAVEPGQIVLIQAAASGVSSFAIQMAKHLGAIVIACSRSSEKLEQAKKWGADFTLLNEPSSFRRELKQILQSRGQHGVDVVIDHVGGATFQHSIKSLDWGGKMVICGSTTESEVFLDLKPLFFKNISILGSTLGGRKDFNQVLDLVKKKIISPYISAVYSMEELPRAYDELEKGDFYGKIILKGT